MIERKIHQNMNISCNVVQMGKVSCSYVGKLVIDEHLVATLTLFDVEMDDYIQIENERDFCICAKAENDYYTLKADMLISATFSCIEKEGDLCSKAKVECGISDVLAGSEFALDKKGDLVFEGFSCQVTDMFELVGLYPYEIKSSCESWEIGTTSITGKEGSLEFDGGFSCFVEPYIYKKNCEYIFSMQGKINYTDSELKDLDELKSKMNLLRLLFEILCGEYVAILEIDVQKGKHIFEYIGVNNSIKSRLNCLNNNSDPKFLLRKGVFKLSDWCNDGKEVIQKFCDILENNLLAMESYKQLLLDEEVNIMTYNSFLKIMQMVEGVMRKKELDIEKEEFNNKKEEIIGKLKITEDKEFIKKYCNDNGISFRTCLKGISQECICLLSGIIDGYNKIYGDVINKIINDRDAYTHASKTSRPIMTEKELRDVNCCYKIFFRIIILKRLGMNEEMIRIRLMHNRYFIFAYEKLFGLSIMNVEDTFEKNEFDTLMWKYT